jgi:hypothetical protein
MTAGVSPAAFEAATAVVSDQVCADIVDCADIVASLARSIAEAAFRQDPIQLRIYRPQFREQAVLLLALIRDLAPLPGEVACAAKPKGVVQ